MREEQASLLRALLASRSWAALGTLHSGAPYVSMAPFAMFADGSAFVIHVSQLAAHTRDMQMEPRVSLLITGIERAGETPLALPRVTIQGMARQTTVDMPEYAFARETYLGRFPEGVSMFSLGDFSLFVITPIEVRWVAGFAQARTLSAAAFARAIQNIDD